MGEERTDVLVVGSGIGGASAAVSAYEKGVSVTLITKAKGPTEATTRYAQGGIATLGAEDSPALFEGDILSAGCGINDPSAVRILTTEGPKLVGEVLIGRLRVPFDRDSRGGLVFGRESGHSLPRILHCADATGSAIEKAFMQYILQKTNIRVLTEVHAFDLLVRDGRVWGCTILQKGGAELQPLLARRTILATGGIGDLYLYTTNPPGNSGDGVAMAARAGALIRNAEFIQFHPTVYFPPAGVGGRPLLITEAIRGEGAILRNACGEAFMERYDPVRKDLSFRYVIATAVEKEIQDTGGVVLDLEPVLKKVDFPHRFPSVYQGCLKAGLDILKEGRVPVQPAQHFFCGGIAVNENGQTTLCNLYAVGECAESGVHGADRLSSTSLLEGLVWGWRAGAHAGEEIRSLTDTAIPTVVAPSCECVDQPLPSGFTREKFRRLQTLMWKEVGIQRTLSGLERTYIEALKLKGEADDYARFRVDPELNAFRNACLLASIISRSAAGRKSSLGSHRLRE